MIVVLCKYREQVPFNGIHLDARQTVMIRNFRARLQHDGTLKPYTVLIDYVSNPEIDDLLRNRVVLRLRCVLYGVDILQFGLPQKWHNQIEQWLDADGSSTVARTVRLTPEQKQALQLLNLQESDASNLVLIKERYKKLVLEYHPDKGGTGTSDHLDALRKAKAVLIDP